MVLRVALVALGVLAFGGQLDPFLGPAAQRPQALPAPLQELPDHLGEAKPLAWPADGTLACDGHCSVEIPRGASGDLWVLWDGSQTTGFVAAVEGAQDEELRPAVAAFDAAWVEGIADADRLHLWGEGEAEVQVLRAAQGLPNLAALAPAHIGRLLPDGAACLAEETAAGLRQCLRFSTGVANTGDTALDLRSLERAGDVTMVQALPGPDRHAGMASYHASHGHFHYARFMAFALHEVDAATGLRGGEVLASAKTGFCVVDWGTLADAEALPAKTYWRDDCEPTAPHLRMGVNPGWYDLYRWFLPEQALDVHGLPPGTYELIVTVDPDWSVEEAHRLDNRASTVFAWDGAAASLLEERALYRLTQTCPPWC